MRQLQALVLCATVFCVTSCSNEGVIGDLIAKYPIEVESCICRYLAFEADSYSGVKFPEMVEYCNTTTRSGHPSLPEDIRSEPSMSSLRCPEYVEDWQGVVAEAEAQQASNRRNFDELMKAEEATEEP